MPSDRSMHVNHAKIVNSPTWCGPIHNVVTLRDIKSRDNSFQSGRSWIRSRRISLGCFERRPSDRDTEPTLSTHVGQKKPASTHDLSQQPLCSAVIQPDKDVCRFQRSKSTHATHMGAGGLLRRMRRRASEKSRCNTPSDSSPCREIVRGHSSQSMSRSCQMELADGKVHQKPVWRSASTMVNATFYDAPHTCNRVYGDSPLLQSQRHLLNHYSRRSSPGIHEQMFRGPPITPQLDSIFQTQRTLPMHHQLIAPTASYPSGQQDCTSFAVTDNQEELLSPLTPEYPSPSNFTHLPRPSSYLVRSGNVQGNQQSQVLQTDPTAFLQPPLLQHAIVHDPDYRPSNPQRCNQMFIHQAGPIVASSLVTEHSHSSNKQTLDGRKNNIEQPESQSTFEAPPNTVSAFGNYLPRVTTSPFNNTELLQRPLSNQSLRPDSLLSMFSTTGESSTSESFPNSSSSRDSAIGGDHLAVDTHLKCGGEKQNMIETRYHVPVSEINQFMPVARHPTMNQLVSALPPEAVQPRTRVHPLPLPSSAPELPRLPPTPRRHVWLPHAPESVLVTAVSNDLPAIPPSRRMRAERRQQAIYVNSDIPAPSNHHTCSSPIGNRLTVSNHNHGPNQSQQTTTAAATPWTHLLPYRTSTVPQNLSERLKKSETLPNDIWDQVRQSKTAFLGSSSYARPGKQCLENPTTTGLVSSGLNSNRSFRQSTVLPKTQTARPKSSPPRPPVRSTSQVESTPLSDDKLDSELSELSLRENSNGLTQDDQLCANPGTTVNTLPQSRLTQLDGSPLLCRYSQLYSLGTASFPSYPSKIGQNIIDHPDVKSRKFGMHSRPQC